MAFVIFNGVNLGSLCINVLFLRYYILIQQHYGNGKKFH